MRELREGPERREPAPADGIRKGAKAAAAAAAPLNAGNSFNGGNGSGYSVDEIEQIVREGAPAEKNRSEVFHTVVGHYLGVGWEAEQIFAHLQQFPNGIGGRYLGEGRLSGEIARSANKYAAGTLPQSDPNGWTNGFEAKAPASEPSKSDGELEELDDDSSVESEEPSPSPQDIDLGADQELDEEESPALDPELDDLLDDELAEDGSPTQDPNLPTLYCHGDPDTRALKDWLIKYLMPVCGFGLLSGQWGTGKTFVLFDLAASLMMGTPFCGEMVKRQCGVLLIAAEGAQEVRLRLGAMVREKCGNAKHMPFRWYESAPVLLQKGSREKLIAMARQADASLQAEFGLPLGLVVLDTLGACTGFTKAGEENDTGVGQAIMDTLKAVSLALNCFALGVAHFGKDISRGTRGTSSREDAGDVVWVCLGGRTVSGSVVNTRRRCVSTRVVNRGWNSPSRCGRWRNLSRMKTVTPSLPRSLIGCPPVRLVVPVAPVYSLRILGLRLDARINGLRCYGSSARSWPSWRIRVLSCRFLRTAR